MCSVVVHSGKAHGVAGQASHVGQHESGCDTRWVFGWHVSGAHWQIGQIGQQPPAGTVGAWPLAQTCSIAGHATPWQLSGTHVGQQLPG